MEIKLNALLQQLSLEEKIMVLAGADLWHTMPVDRLGIPVFKVTDGPNGARGSGGSSGPSSACFPVGSALAATWNTDLVERVGAALGEETSAKGAQILLAPTVNIHRSPLAGRNFECYSEDPYLTSCLALAYIKGVQSQGVGACIKHFVGNDSEFERKSISSEIDERALHEIYLLPFWNAVREARPWAVMSAYNKLNGTYCSENRYLLTDLLKGEWGFDGIVISDWYGTYSPAVPVGGLDLEMPGPARWMGVEHVHAALKEHRIGLADIDDRVRRILWTIERAGKFEHPELEPERSIDKIEHRRLARQAAQEAIVLLKNEGEILPIDPSRVKSIAVIGENARWAQVMGGGSSEVTPHYVVSPLDGIIERAGESVQVKYEIGCDIHRSIPLLDPDWVTAAKTNQRGFRLEFFNNLDLAGEPVKVIVTDRMKLAWSDELLDGVDSRCFSARLSGEFSPPETGMFTFSLRGNGIYRMFLDGKLILDQWADKIIDEPPWGSQEYRTSVELKAGNSYQLTIEYAWKGQTHYREIRIGGWPPISDRPIEDAVALSESVDLVIIIAGLTKEWESEGFDRRDMMLPGQQNELIARVAAANPNTVVVLNVGSPVEMPWFNQVGAVLQAWYLGQETGHALADVLFGDVNPSGKLPTTFPRRLQDNPAYINYPGENGKVAYGEGIFVGYRYYDKKEVEPLFPFGFGLSYTKFAYSQLSIERRGKVSNRKILVSAQVQNIGERFGQEVVQLYLKDIESSLVRPPKELKAFAKVNLEPGEIKQVSFSLDRQALCFYDDARKEWVDEPGTFEVNIASSSRHVHLRGQFEWEAGERVDPD